MPIAIPSFRPARANPPRLRGALLASAAALALACAPLPVLSAAAAQPSEQK